MKKIHLPAQNISEPKKGYNEKNPGQPDGSFPPDSAEHTPAKNKIKSAAADKKAKEDQQ